MQGFFWSVNSLARLGWPTLWTESLKPMIPLYSVFMLIRIISCRLSSKSLPHISKMTPQMNWQMSLYLQRSFGRKYLLSSQPCQGSGTGWMRIPWSSSISSTRLCGIRSTAWGILTLCCSTWILWNINIAQFRNSRLTFCVHFLNGLCYNRPVKAERFRKSKETDWGARCIGLRGQISAVDPLTWFG